MSCCCRGEEGDRGGTRHAGEINFTYNFISTAFSKEHYLAAGAATVAPLRSERQKPTVGTVIVATVQESSLYKAEAEGRLSCLAAVLAKAGAGSVVNKMPKQV